MYFMCMDVLPKHVPVTHMHAWLLKRPEGAVEDSLFMELWMVGCHPMGVGNET